MSTKDVLEEYVNDEKEEEDKKKSVLADNQNTYICKR